MPKVRSHDRQAKARYSLLLDQVPSIVQAAARQISAAAGERRLASSAQTAAIESWPWIRSGVQPWEQLSDRSLSLAWRVALRRLASEGLPRGDHRSILDACAGDRCLRSSQAGERSTKAQLARRSDRSIKGALSQQAAPNWPPASLSRPAR